MSRSAHIVRRVSGRPSARSSRSRPRRSVRSGACTRIPRRRPRAARAACLRSSRPSNTKTEPSKLAVQVTYCSGHAFYPLSTGDYREYKVRQINYSILANPDTITYFLKEETGDSYINQTGTTTFTLNRYKRSNDTLAWEIDSVWTVIKSQTNIVVRENNIPYTKLIFPVLDQKQWDGNAFNIYEEELYTYEATYHPFIIGNKEYKPTLKVIQANNPDSIVMKDIRSEIYAENIGLIYKESIILYYCTENECLGEQIIEQGMDFRSGIDRVWE